MTDGAQALLDRFDYPRERRVFACTRDLEGQRAALVESAAEDQRALTLVHG